MLCCWTKRFFPRLVVFANKLFTNIAGKSVQDKTDLVVIDAGEGDIESFRNSWREEISNIFKIKKTYSKKVFLL